MAQFAWTEELLTGVVWMDDEHRRWIVLVNAVLNALDCGYAADYISELVEVMFTYARGHFLREEAEMFRVGYASSGAHRAEHAEWLRQVVAIKRSLDAGERINAIGIQNYLMNAIGNHILGADARLASILQAQNDATTKPAPSA